MAEESSTQVQLLRRQKAKLIEILSADADFILQHADARCLLSPRAYQQVKSCRVPSEKVTDLLDHILDRGPEATQGMLDLLKEQDILETFPLLCFLEKLQVGALPSDTKTRKRSVSPENPSVSPTKKICNISCGLVKEKQLMSVARNIGRSWREIGRLALGIQSVKLEQIEDDHSLHVERVFAMLRYWRNCQREKATAANLHSLLSHEDWALPPESISVLLETD